MLNIEKLNDLEPELLVEEIVKNSVSLVLSLEKKKNIEDVPKKGIFFSTLTNHGRFTVFLELDKEDINCNCPVCRDRNVAAPEKHTQEVVKEFSVSLLKALREQASKFKN